MFGVAVDHVGGLTKVTIRQEVAVEKKIGNAFEMIKCLFRKFDESDSLIYFFKEIMQSDLEIERAKSKL